MNHRIARMASNPNGTAIFTVLLIMFLFAAVAGGLLVVVRIETLVASRYRQSVEALFAAEGAMDAAVAELRAIPDWSPVVAGTYQSGQSQGTFQGSKAIPGGGSVPVCCGPGSAAYRLSTDTLLSALPARRAMQWRPFLWTSLDALAPRNPGSRLYVVVWIGNDEEDRDGADSADTNHTVVVRAEALAATGMRRVVEALVARQPLTGGPFLPGSTSESARLNRVAVLSWREVR